MNYQRLKALRSAGRVLRAHTIPLIHRQTVGEHTFGVMAILSEIAPDDEEMSVELLMAALHHDAPEFFTGDVPATAKWNHIALEEGLRRAEENIIKSYGFFKLPEGSREARLVKYADCMELAMFSLEEMQMGNWYAKKMAFNAIEAIKRKGLIDITPEAKNLYDFVRLKFERMQKELAP